MKKWLAAALCILLVLGFALFWPKGSLLGRWESEEGYTLEISETHFTVDGIPLPYELGKNGQFVLDSGILGPVRGSYRLENQRLLLSVDGLELEFRRA